MDGQHARVGKLILMWDVTKILKDKVRMIPIPKEKAPKKVFSLGLPKNETMEEFEKAWRH